MPRGGVLLEDQNLVVVVSEQGFDYCIRSIASTDQDNLRRMPPLAT